MGFAGLDGAEEERDEVRFRFVFLAEREIGVGSAGVEIAQGDAANAAAQVHPAEDFLYHGLRFAIRADRTDGGVLGDGDGIGIAIDGGGGGEDELADARLDHGGEQGERAAGVVGEVKLRGAGGFADGDVGGEMDDGVDSLRREDAREGSGVGEREMVEGDAGDVVAVAAGEVVDNDGVEAAFLEQVRGVRADVAGAAGDEDAGH